MIRITLYLIGILLCVIGLFFITLNLNQLVINLNLFSYILFIIKHLECNIFFIGIIILTLVYEK